MRLLTSARRFSPTRGRARPSSRRPVVRTALGIAALFTASLAALPTQAQAAASAPFGGTAAALPGLVEAANYDTGG
jgi:beta-glucosidase